jgi:hypothetical protein
MQSMKATLLRTPAETVAARCRFNEPLSFWRAAR